MKWPIGTRVNKFFDDYQEYFGGCIDSFDASTGFYKLQYDDGDVEDVDAVELEGLVVNNAEEEEAAMDTSGGGIKDYDDDDESSPTGVASLRTSPRSRTKKRVSYKEETSSDEEEDEDDEDEAVKKVKVKPKTATATSSEATAAAAAAAERPKKKKKRQATLFDMFRISAPPPKKKQKAQQQQQQHRRRPATAAEEDEDFEMDDEDMKLAAANDDDEEFVVAVGDDDDDDEDLDSVFDDSDDDDDFDAPGKKRKSSAKKSATKKNTTAKKTKATKASGGDPEKKSMAESFKPLDTPLFWKMSLKEIKKQQEYLDPCGMEATDDIIDHLVGEQVLKIGKLLERALTKEDKTLGCEKRPLALGTACSGTDAPALALTIVQEQMERYNLKAKLHYNHTFSCEKEPFKQSYLASNMDFEALYPDIVKLTDDEPLDVYGRIHPLPKTNTFVAGTSCKNFSMLRSTQRLDIEDKGCSGETFLAAVEYLFKEQPDFTIFENVIGAPWAKMQEYVTGRVPLATAEAANKAIKSTRKEDLATKALTFEIQDNGDIMASAIPLNVGVRCGAVVEGFLRGTKLTPATWPKKNKKTCTLSELIKENSAKTATDTLVFKTPSTYNSCIVKVDSKNYGLPQTRQRTYMFVWKVDKKGDYDDDLGLYWQAIVKYLESPVKHSLDAFILDTDHDKVRVFREALRGPPGRHAKRAVFQEPDFFTSGNANVRHNTIARDKSGIEMLTRTTTMSGAHGRKQIPPHYWLEYLDCQPQRELDMLDILHASAARDGECHDSYHSSFFWNISQNVSKEKHRTSVPGIAGCISPGGEFFVTNLGRPLLGCEKLLLQGIPFFRLLLGNETEVQLGDLAGNAMSLTVVGATLLAAIGCRQLRNECPDAKNVGDILKFLSKGAGIDHSSQGVVIPTIPASTNDLEETDFHGLASLASEAVQSSVWCTCETSGRNSDATHFLCCRTCRVSCCASCLGTHSGYQMESHTCVEIKLTPQEHCLGSFLTKLRDVAPASLVFGSEGMSFLESANDKDEYRVKDLHKFTFNLQKIQRQRRKWALYYNARDNNGIGEVVASFIVTVGELSTVSNDDNTTPRLGLRGSLISYFPAKTTPLVSGQLQPCAVLTVEQGSKQHDWKALTKSSVASLKISGENDSPSFRLELGLLDKADEQLRKNAYRGAQKKHFQKSQSIGEERRWIYPTNWKNWPAVLSVDCDDYSLVNGTYNRCECRQTINQSALWMRSGDDEPLYLIIKPNVTRTGPDVAVISSSISPDDFSDIILTLPSSWQPCDALIEKKQTVKARRSNWKDVSTMRCSTAAFTATVGSPDHQSGFLSVRGLSDAQISMLYPFESNESIIQLNVHGGNESQKIVRSFNYLCVPSILRYVAQSQDLRRSLSPEAEWISLKSSAETPFGCCETTIPPRPAEDWVFDEERKTWMRSSSPEASREYYRRLEDAPTTFEFTLNKKARTLSIRCNPRVVAHFASYFLLNGRDLPVNDGNLKVEYRMADMTLQSDPSYSPYKVFPCKSEEPAIVALKAPYALYERQQKVVAKMSMIETGKVSYEELEMAEHEMPSSAGFSVIAKASRERRIVGGVIADAIGAGKTVVSIALILQGLDTARKSRSTPKKSGATLVVVPSGLIDQWKSEIAKFTDGLKVICVHDLKKLKLLTVNQIVEADVIVAPVDIVESKDYCDNLTKKSGQMVAEIPRDIGQKEKAGVRGVWIPATSQDPYGIGASNEMKNQRKRELSAFFTSTYMKAIEEIRKKSFKPTDKGVPLEYFEWERVIVDGRLNTIVDVFVGNQWTCLEGFLYFNPLLTTNFSLFIQKSTSV